MNLFRWLAIFLFQSNERAVRFPEEDGQKKEKKNEKKNEKKKKKRDFAFHSLDSI